MGSLGPHEGPINRNRSSIGSFGHHLLCANENPFRLGVLFESEVLHALCPHLRIQKAQTTQYRDHSEWNTESLKSTLSDMFAKTANHHPAEWDLYLPWVLVAYNSAVHTATGYSPYYLQFGRSIRLPVDLTADRSQNALKTHNSP